MKDKLLNLLMLLTVGAALALTLLRPTSVNQESPLPAVTALPTRRPAEAFRLRREKTREREKDTLLALRDGEGWAEETRTLAAEALRQTLLADETELAVEAVLAGKGYADALCVYREGSLTVLAAAPLREEDAALVRDLAAEIAGVAPDHVRISGL